MAQRNQVKDPNKTKTGKTRLGGLSVAQLNKLLTASGKPKEKAKILNQIRIAQARPGYVAPVSDTETAS